VHQGHSGVRVRGVNSNNLVSIVLESRSGTSCAPRFVEGWGIGLKGSTHFDERNFDPFDWAFVEMVFGFANILGFTPSELMVGDAPTGPAVRGGVST